MNLAFNDERKHPFIYLDYETFIDIAPKISSAAFKTYVGILSFAGNKTGEAYPSRATLGARIGLSTDTITRSFKELEAAGLITVEPQRNPITGAQIQNLITIKNHRQNLDQTPPQTDTRPRYGLAAQTKRNRTKRRRTRRTLLCSPFGRTGANGPQNNSEKADADSGRVPVDGEAARLCGGKRIAAGRSRAGVRTLHDLLARLRQNENRLGRDLAALGADGA